MIFSNLAKLNSKETIEYKFNWYPSIEVKDNIIIFPDSSKFETYNTNGVWEDNFGNYGFNKCMGIINKNFKNVELYFMCEREDKNGFKIWSINRRNSGVKSSGVGSFQIVDATIPKKDLFIGKKCTYAVKYLKDTNFYKSKCKISKELSKVFEKMALGKH